MLCLLLQLIGFLDWFVVLVSWSLVIFRPYWDQEKIIYYLYTKPTATRIFFTDDVFKFSGPTGIMKSIHLFFVIQNRFHSSVNTHSLIFDISLVLILFLGSRCTIVHSRIRLSPFVPTHVPFSISPVPLRSSNLLGLLWS